MTYAEYNTRHEIKPMWTKYLFFVFFVTIFLGTFSGQKQTPSFFYGAALVNSYHTIKKFSIATLVQNFSFLIEKNRLLQFALKNRYLKEANLQKSARAAILIYGSFNAILTFFFLKKARKATLKQSTQTTIKTKTTSQQSSKS